MFFRYHSTILVEFEVAMIPYSYNMVDMAGIDLAEVNGSEVPGIYSRIVEAVNSCGDVILYNWKFASIEISPQYTQILLVEDGLIINGVIQVTELDQVSIIGVEPPVPPLVPLVATENRQYNPEPPIVGFSPVTVSVPIPIPRIVDINIEKNGTYDPQDHNADGFGIVSVNVSGTHEDIEAVHVWTNSTGGTNASVYVQGGYVRGFEFIPTGEAESILYSTVTGNPREFDLISLAYVNQWRVTAKDVLIYNYASVLLSGNSVSWLYNATVNNVFVLKGE